LGSQESDIVNKDKNENLILNLLNRKKYPDIEKDLNKSLLINTTRDVGQLYREVIPSDVRHDLGQYYTPPEVCEFICRLTIKNPEDIVLDPAVGAGDFLINAYKTIKRLKDDNEQDYDHDSLLEQIYGIEINRFPARVSKIKLALQVPGSEIGNANVETTDFFQLDPTANPLVSMRFSTSDDQKTNLTETTIPAKVDVVLGNPPYIRQEKITNKALVRSHLAQLGGKPPYTDRLDERSDIYVYFFTHSAQWLSNGGRLCFLTSERYLDTQYGRGLQQFILENFEIHTIISFDKHMFEDALIGTCITLLRKEKDKEKRDKNIIQFLLLKNKMEISELISLIEALPSMNSFISESRYNVATISQSKLIDDPKWRKFIIAPPIYYELIKSSFLARLDAIAIVRSGIKTGSNNFFYRRKEDFKNLGDCFPNLQQYYRPLVKALGQTDLICFQPDDTDWYVLDIHDLVEEIIEESRAIDDPGTVDKSLVKKQLIKKGHQVLVDYINAAEKGELDFCGKNTPQTNITCASRSVWFDLGKLPLDGSKNGIGFPKEYWTKYTCPIIDPSMTVDQRVHYIEPRKWSKNGLSINEYEVLAGILNSDLSALFYEIQGRIYAGQALDRACMTIYEAKELLIIDPRQLPVESLLLIQESFRNLMEKERDLIPKKTGGTFFEITSKASDDEKNKRKQYLELRRKLNRAVLGAIGKENMTREIEATVQRFINLRRTRGGQRGGNVITNGREV
jgi:hypothetical protein